MVGGRTPHGRGRSASRRLDRATYDIAHGRFEQSLSGLTAVAAVITSAEIFIEHYRASFGNKMMWSPILVAVPVVVSGIGGVFSRRWARRALPAASALYILDGLVGEYLHGRGIHRRPGGWHEAAYNVPMGPPIVAPGLMTIVGAMGVLAALLRREEDA